MEALCLSVNSHIHKQMLFQKLCQTVRNTHRITASIVQRSSDTLLCNSSAEPTETPSPSSSQPRPPLPAASGQHPSVSANLPRLLRLPISRPLPCTHMQAILESALRYMTAARTSISHRGGGGVTPSGAWVWVIFDSLIHSPWPAGETGEVAAPAPERVPVPELGLGAVPAPAIHGLQQLGWTEVGTVELCRPRLPEEPTEAIPGSPRFVPLPVSLRGTHIEMIWFLNDFS